MRMAQSQPHLRRHPFLKNQKARAKEKVKEREKNLQSDIFEETL